MQKERTITISPGEKVIIVTLEKEEETFSIEEFAQLINRDKSSVYRQLKTSKISSLKVGTKTRIPKSELSKFKTKQNE